MSFFLQGPINASQAVILCYQKGSTIYILNSYIDTAGARQIFYDSNVKGIISGDGNTVPIFSIAGNSTSITLNGSMGGLSWNDSFIAGLASVGRTITQSQNIVQPWDPPVISLTGVQYQLLTTQGPPISFRIGSMTSTGPKFEASNVFGGIYATTIWFFGCNGNTCTENNTSIGTITSYYCANTTADPSTCAGIQTFGWTDINDAKVGVRYQYCVTGSNCSAQCKGPCTQMYGICEYNTSSGEFGCKNDPQESGVPWFEQPWFFILMVFIGLIVFFFIIYLVTRKKT